MQVEFIFTLYSMCIARRMYTAHWNTPIHIWAYASQLKCKNRIGSLGAILARSVKSNSKIILLFFSNLPLQLIIILSFKKIIYIFREKSFLKQLSNNSSTIILINHFSLISIFFSLYLWNIINSIPFSIKNIDWMNCQIICLIYINFGKLQFLRRKLCSNI